MKFRLTFKTPDVLNQAIEKHLGSHCEEHEEHHTDCDACNSLEEKHCNAIEKILTLGDKFLQSRKYLTVEFDTDAGTATVLPVK